MDTTVKSRPNHYELLGITARATGDEIVQAFAKELGLLRPRAFGTLAEVTVAYETLRDPAKRAVYDASLGFKSDPPVPESQVPPEWAPFLLRASAKPVEQPKVDPVPMSPPAPRMNLQSRLETPPAPRTAPSATAILRQPIKPDSREIQPILRTKPEELLRSKAVEEPRPERPVSPFESQADAEQLYYAPAEAERFDEVRDRTTNWKVPALAAGALLLAVGVGAWTGWDAGNDNESDQLEPVATIKVPPAKASSEEADTAFAQDTGIVEARSQQPSPAAAAPARATPVRPPLQITLPEVEAAQVDPGQGEEFTTETASAAPSAAKLPLPDAVIARTIDRIGYSCGEVTSTAAVEGAAGVFKVTCASGHSYRAAPVHGRYRFRKLN